MEPCKNANFRFLTTDAHEIYADGWESIDRLKTLANSIEVLQSCSEYDGRGERVDGNWCNNPDETP